MTNLERLCDLICDNCYKPHFIKDPDDLLKECDHCEVVDFAHEFKQQIDSVDTSKYKAPLDPKVLNELIRSD